jgi:ferrous-iron efflux pump FieF
MINQNKFSGEVDPRYALFAAAWAVGTVTILIGAKAWAYWVSGSAAVLATLTDSLSDAGISLMMLFALRYSLRPADKGHRHGHGKAEGLAALFQAAFLGGAGFFLALSALQRFAEPQAVTHHMTGIGVAVMAIILSVLLLAVQNYCLKKAPSLAVEADKMHYTSDVYLNLAVIVALVVDYQGGPAGVDALCALGVAIYLGRAAIKIAKSAADMLMDKEMPAAVRTRIEKIVRSHDDVHDMHDLRTRKSGMIIHISFDVEIDPEMPLKDAHQVTRDLETMIIDDFPHAEIIIHMDPVGDIHDARHRVKGVHH